jgi:hypothetical protein
MKTNDVLAMPIGLTLLAIAILMMKFLPATSVFDFTEGFLIGLSIVLNIYYIYVVSKNNKKEI